MRIKKLSVFLLAALFIYLPVQAKLNRRYKPQTPAILVDSREDFKRLARKPDSTVLRTKSGKRVTLGKLRAYAKAHGTPLGVKKN
jgi:hypothetical protein